MASGSQGTGMSHPNDCNVYAVDCGEEHVLVDSGIGQDTAQLLTNLTTDGIQLERVRKLLLTHAHLDHSGGSGFLREVLHLEVCASPGSARALETGDEALISLNVAKEAGVYPPSFEFQACPVDRILRDHPFFCQWCYGSGFHCLGPERETSSLLLRAVGDVHPGGPRLLGY